jgi:hypothetical protein
MYSRGASFLGAKRPREEHESADRAEALGLAVGYPSSMVAEVGNNAAHYVEGEHNSPPRHSPGVTPGACAGSFLRAVLSTRVSHRQSSERGFIPLGRGRGDDPLLFLFFS